MRFLKFVDSVGYKSRSKQDEEDGRGIEEMFEGNAFGGGKNEVSQDECCDDSDNSAPEG